MQYTPEETLDMLRGRQVWIEHDAGIVTRYAHLDSINPEIQPGMEISAGQFVGTVGNTGTRASSEGKKDGPHLHLEIWLTDDALLGT